MLFIMSYCLCFHQYQYDTVKDDELPPGGVNILAMLNLRGGVNQNFSIYYMEGGVNILASLIFGEGSNENKRG